MALGGGFQAETCIVCRSMHSKPMFLDMLLRSFVVFSALQLFPTGKVDTCARLQALHGGVLPHLFVYHQHTSEVPHIFLPYADDTPIPFASRMGVSPCRT